MSKINLNYSSYTDVYNECKRWDKYIKRIKEIYNDKFNMCKNNDYYKNIVPEELKKLFNDILVQVEKSNVFVKDLHSKLQNDVLILEKDIINMNKLGKDYTNLKDKLESTYSEKHEWKQYGQTEFKLVKELYLEYRSFLQCFSNLQDSSTKLNILLDNIDDDVKSSLCNPDER